MSTLELVIEDLKKLPPASLEKAAEYVHGLREVQRDERQKILRETFGAWSNEDGAAIEKAILEDGEKIDTSGW